MSVLVSVDFSEVSEKQLEIVGRMYEDRSRKVYLLHVAEPDPDFVGFEAGPNVVRDQIAEVFHREHRQLQEMAERLRKRGADATALLVQGSIVETVLAEAERIGAALIVVGSHGHGATYDLLVGSVSQGIIRKAKVPVLVVPAR
ncbi:MAG: universal stress protein [Gemmatimonadota bacterium]